jgi:hypothetical protein
MNEDDSSVSLTNEEHFVENQKLETDNDMVLIVKIKVATMEIDYKIKQIKLFKAK